MRILTFAFTSNHFLNFVLLRWYFSDITSSHVRGQKISAIGLRKYLFHKLKELHDTISEEWERITREAPYTCTCQRSDGKHEAYAEFNTEMSHFDVMYHQWVALDGTAAETLENYLQGWTDDYKHTVEDFHTKRNSFLSNQSHNNRAMFENVDLESLLIGTEPAVDERRQSISQLVSSVQQEIRAAHLARWLSENKQILKSDKACDIVWMSGNKEPTNPNLCKKQCEKGTRGELSTTVAEKIESRTRFQPNVKKDLIKRRRVKKFGFTLFRSKYNLRGKTADKLDTEEGREKENEEEEELNGTSIGKEAEQEHIHLDHRFQKDAHGNLAHISLASRYGPRLSNTDRILQYNEYSRLFEVDAHDVEILAKSQAEISVAAVFRLLYSRVGRHNTGRSPQESVALVHPLFVSKLFEQTNLDSVKFNQIFHEHVSFFEEGVESFLMPIYQESRSHFVLAHIWIDNAGRPTLRVMDSVFSKTPMITDIEAELVMVNLFPGGRRANIIDASPSDIPRQDINGCGIETVLNAELALQHRGRDWPKIVPRTRTKVETNIYRHHFSAELENIRREDKLYVEQKATIPTLMGNNSTRHSDQRNELIETSFTSEPVYESEPIFENGMSNMEVNNNTRTSQSVEQEEWNIIRNVECFLSSPKCQDEQNSQKLNSHKKKVSRAARAKTSRFSAHSKIKHTAVISTHKKTKKSINNSGKVIRLNTGVFGNTLTNLPTTTENEEDEGEIDVQSTTAEATLNIPVQSNVEEILMFDNDNSRYESSDNCPHKRQLKDLLDEGKVVRHKTGKFVSATPRNSATLKVITETSNSSGNATMENILKHIEDTLRIVNKRSDRKVLNRCKDLLMKHINQRREDRMDDTETSNDSMIDSEEPMSAEYDPTTPKQPHLKFLSTAQEELLVKQYPTTPISVLSRRFNLSEDPKTARVEARRIMNRREKGLPNHREAVAKLKESVSESVTFRDEIEQQDIHERDITRLGLERARFFGVKAFRGSRHWVQKVKNQCHMKSRHIDARISQRTIDQSARIADDVTMFKCVTVPQLIMKYSASKMWNVDQTGVELEMTRRRTLTRIGTKKVLRRAQRNNSLTHSFTLNICISASGEVLPKCFVTLHEPKPPQSFQTLVAPYTELYVTNSRSGKMDSRLAIEWLEELFLPNVADRSLLLLDSWPGFNQMLDMPIVRRRKLRTVVFPPGTTGELQPLDLQFNRQFKNFLQQIHMEIRRVDPTFIISIRANLLQILSFVYNQIKAPIFKNWIKAGFVQLGVIRTRNSYVVPAQYCLDPTKTGGKSCSKCTKFSSIQCAHCDILFCIICVLKHIH